MKYRLDSEDLYILYWSTDTTVLRDPQSVLIILINH